VRGDLDVSFQAEQVDAFEEKRTYKFMFKPVSSSLVGIGGNASGISTI